MSMKRGAGAAMPETLPRPAGRFPVALTVTVAVSMAILLALGVWQLQRLKWKEGLLAHVEALKTAPARPLADVLRQGGDVAFARVTADCPGLAEAPFVELYAIRDGQAGSRLISVCRPANAPPILVDRGFVADTISARPPVDAMSDAPVRVTGVLRGPEKRNFTTPPNAGGHFYAREIAPIAAALKAPNAAPWFLMAETPTNPRWPALVPAPLPADLPNNHLSYALTWFGLAAALAGVYAAMLLRRRKPA